MSVREVFASAAAEHRSALIGYLPVGFPNVAESIAAMRTMVAAGADIVEVGVPYSDPVIDGPTIQSAVEIALRAGTRVRDVFAAVEAIAEAGATPMVMSYWNPIERYGVAEFARALSFSGGAGLITPDLLPEEATEWIAASDKYQLDRVFLVAPSSTQARLVSTAAACRGFVYAASVMGATGARDQLSNAAPALARRVRAVTDLPVGVGLGVSNGKQAAQVASYADGVIVGSALVSCLLDASDRDSGQQALHELVVDLAEGVRARP
ncbi:MAG: tryptophan synthase subunit alpha [Acidimicrobiales bacterium]|nr:MAG: tryptophan synthase subunit alpha [Acidimicrobiales bacterium]